MDKSEQPTLIFHKAVDKKRNRMFIPKFFVEKYGREFFMYVYTDKLVIMPVRKEK